MKKITKIYKKLCQLETKKLSSEMKAVARLTETSPNIPTINNLILKYAQQRPKLLIIITIFTAKEPALPKQILANIEYPLEFQNIFIPFSSKIFTVH